MLQTSAGGGAEHGRQLVLCRDFAVCSAMNQLHAAAKSSPNDAVCTCWCRDVAMSAQCGSPGHWAPYTAQQRLLVLCSAICLAFWNELVHTTNINGKCCAPPPAHWPVGMYPAN